MTLSKARLKELEERWRHKRGAHKSVGTALVSIVEIPANMADLYRSFYPGPGRPKGLRGRAFMQELTRLALEWRDPRIAQCARALLELGIVNKRGGFTQKRGPNADTLKQQAATQKQQRLADALARVRTLRKRNPHMSEREACTLVVVDLGWGATRRTTKLEFEAAAEQLRNASRARKPLGKPTRG